MGTINEDGEEREMSYNNDPGRGKTKLFVLAGMVAVILAVGWYQYSHGGFDELMKPKHTQGK